MDFLKKRSSENDTVKSETKLYTEARLAWGLHNLPGALKLADGRLSFTAFGPGDLWPHQLRKLESDSGQAGLAELLNDGRAVVFDVPVSDAQIRFPWYYLSGGINVTVNGLRYRLGFDRPAYATPDHWGEFSKARRSGKAWKEIFGEQPSASSTC